MLYILLKITNGTLIADVRRACARSCLRSEGGKERERESPGRWWGRAPEAKSNAIP